MVIKIRVCLVHTFEIVTFETKIFEWISLEWKHLIFIKMEVQTEVGQITFEMISNGRKWSKRIIAENGGSGKFRFRVVFLC